MFFGKWKKCRGELLFKNDDCCICLESNIECVSLPKCCHFICIKCFRQCYLQSKETNWDSLYEQCYQRNIKRHQNGGSIEDSDNENIDLGDSDNENSDNESEHDSDNESDEEPYNETLARCPYCRV